MLFLTTLNFVLTKLFGMQKQYFGRPYKDHSSSTHTQFLLYSSIRMALAKSMAHWPVYFEPGSTLWSSTPKLNLRTVIQVKY